MTNSFQSQVKTRAKERIKASLQAVTSIICSLTNSQRHSLNTVIAFAARKQELHASQQTIAKWGGFCRKTITRATILLESLGLINVERYKYQTNIYTLPGWFYTREVQEVLQPLLLPIRKLFTQNVPLLRFLSSKVESKEYLYLEKRADFSKNERFKREEVVAKRGVAELLKYWESSPPTNKEVLENV